MSVHSLLSGDVWFEEAPGVVVAQADISEKRFSRVEWRESSSSSERQTEEEESWSSSEDGVCTCLRDTAALMDYPEPRDPPPPRGPPAYPGIVSVLASVGARKREKRSRKVASCLRKREYNDDRAALRKCVRSVCRTCRWSLGYTPDAAEHGRLEQIVSALYTVRRTPCVSYTRSHMNLPSICSAMRAGHMTSLVSPGYSRLSVCATNELSRAILATHFRQLYVAFQVVSVLRHAHEHGVVHGGVSAHNVAIDPSTLCLTLHGWLQPTTGGSVTEATRCAVYRWAHSEMTTLDYVLELNALSGRVCGDPDNNPFVPWVVDFSC